MSFTYFAPASVGEKLKVVRAVQLRKHFSGTISAAIVHASLKPRVTSSRAVQFWKVRVMSGLASTSLPRVTFFRVVLGASVVGAPIMVATSTVPGALISSIFVSLNRLATSLVTLSFNVTAVSAVQPEKAAPRLSPRLVLLKSMLSRLVQPLKASAPIEVVAPLIVTVAREVQPSNAFAPIVLMPGIVTSAKLVQPLKALSSMVAAEPSVAVARAVQPSNALSSIVRAPVAPGTEIEARAVQPLKAFSPIVVRTTFPALAPEAIVLKVTPVRAAPSNALSPIVVTVLGNVIAVPLKPLNAEAPIVTSPSGRVMLVSLV